MLEPGKQLLVRSGALDSALAGACLIWVAWIAIATSPDRAAPFLIAPMGASAVLMFMAPQSPMAQPWSLIGGHLLSALVGTSATRCFGTAWWVGPLAVGVAIFLMHLGRCSHPPGGATALFSVVGPPSIQDLGFSYVLNPVLLNVAAFYGYYALARWLRSSLRGEAVLQPPREPMRRSARIRLADADVRYAVEESENYVDATDEQLSVLCNLAVIHHEAARLTGKPLPPAAEENRPRCGFGTPLGDCWLLMERSGFNTLPVLDPSGRLLGVVRRQTLRGLLLERNVEPTSRRAVAAAFAPSPSVHTHHPEAAGQVMERVIETVGSDVDQATACRKLLRSGQPFVAVLDERQRYVGLVTSRLLRLD